MKAEDIIQPVSKDLLDPDNQFWTSSELLSYISDAQRQIINLDPSANTQTEALKLDKGVRQTLPDMASRLLDVTRNIEGSAITAVDQRDLDRACPDWPVQDPADVIEHYMYDDRSPTMFLVYPPAKQDTKVEIVYSATLEDVDNSKDTLALNIQYRSIIIEYVLYRAHSKDTEAAVPQRAAVHYNRFLQMAGVQSKVSQTVAAGEPDPNNPRELR